MLDHARPECYNPRAWARFLRHSFKRSKRTRSALSRNTPRLALGLEGGTLGNEAYNAGKGVVVVRMDLRATLSGGCTGNYLEDKPSSYVALGVYRTF